MTDWSEIVQRHGPAVWRTVHRLVSHDADAADCFQRTFVSALELARAEEVRNWPALLKRLATLAALQCLRGRYREAGRVTALPESPADRRAVLPDQAAEASELAGELRAALTELEPTQAQVVCLACLEGLSYQQVAEQLGLTVNHVGVLLHRARGVLRERLRAFEPPAAGPIGKFSHD